MEDIFATIDDGGAHYLLGSVKCYLCDHQFIDGEEPWLIFEKRLQENGRLECSLSGILSSALDREVSEKTAHSKLLCEGCNEMIIEYGNIEQRFREIRFRIISEYNEMAKRNGLPLIPIEINGIQRKSWLKDGIDCGVYPTQCDALSSAKEYFMLSDQENSIEPLPVGNELVVIGSDDIVLDSLIDEPHNAVDNESCDFDALAPSIIKLEQQSDCDIANDESEKRADLIMADSNDTIYYEIIEQSPKIREENEATSIESSLIENLQKIESEDNPAVLDFPPDEIYDNIDNQQDKTESKYLSSPESRQFKDVQKSMYEQDGCAYSCLLCPSKEKYTPKSFSEHMQRVHGYRFYTCDLCGSGFSRRQELNDHMEQEQHFGCTVCQRTFNNYRLFRIHKRSHYPSGKQFECSECHKKYSSKNLLDGHMNMHTGKRPYKCPQCPKDFASKYTLQTHLKIHGDRQRPYQCDQCEKAFFNQQNLSQHRKLHSGVKSFVCNVCSKAFGTQHNLYVHQIVHSGNKPFICRTCGKAFARRAEIKDHERIHTGERPFKCDICDMAFAQRSNLASHKKSTHFNEKLHKCQHCEKSFKRRRLLDYHIQSTHTGERPHKCEICGSSFVYPEHHKKHMLIHLGVKPYACEVCGKQFNSRDNRNAHRFIHSDKKPYECLECGAGYMRKPLLLAHMKLTNHSNDTIIVNQPQISICNKVPARQASDLLEGHSDDKVHAEIQIITESESETLLDSQTVPDVNESYVDILECSESLLETVNNDIIDNGCDDDNDSNDIIASVNGQLIKDEVGEVKYLQLEELDGEGHQTLTWIDIGQSNT